MDYSQVQWTFNKPSEWTEYLLSMSVGLSKSKKDALEVLRIKLSNLPAKSGGKFGDKRAAQLLYNLVCANNWEELNRLYNKHCS